MQRYGIFRKQYNIQVLFISTVPISWFVRRKHATQLFQHIQKPLWWTFVPYSLILGNLTIFLSECRHPNIPQPPLILLNILTGSDNPMSVSPPCHELSLSFERTDLWLTSLTMLLCYSVFCIENTKIVTVTYYYILYIIKIFINKVRTRQDTE